MRCSTGLKIIGNPSINYGTIILCVNQRFLMFHIKYYLRHNSKVDQKERACSMNEGEENFIKNFVGKT
jgi:hypothetical protein